LEELELLFFVVEAAYRLAMLTVCLFEPEIPPNTGNIIRLCANTGSRLHLIRPLGFSLDQKAVRRSGLDYHDLAKITEFPNWKSYLQDQSQRKFAVSTRGTVCYNQVEYQPNDILVFGPETRGLPDDVRDSDAFESVIKIPMQPNNRSLNLSNSVAIVLYEAWRQLSFTGAQT
jgi:tRNA (cytidine/uridine-2'-O-)-methyltransferase|tara:strand:+ start:195 stop:713 length:519 start_codon:yes stop_codon:yes gene_type:complete